MRSNLSQWKALQERGYFEKHIHFKNYTTIGHETLPSIEFFTKLRSTDRVVIVGCGYGRETIQIAPHVRWVWGIDVTENLLQKALEVTSSQGIYNFTGILADSYSEQLPDDIDLVYSVVTMQHLTRDLVFDYFGTLSKKLSPQGAMVVQFLERLGDKGNDADLRVYEPSVTWRKKQIGELAKECGLTSTIRTVNIEPKILHHWGYFKVKEE